VSLERKKTAEAESLSEAEGSMVVLAKREHGHSAGVEDRITHGRQPSEPRRPDRVLWLVTRGGASQR
jgi:hypothetical protein